MEFYGLQAFKTELNQTDMKEFALNSAHIFLKQLEKLVGRKITFIFVPFYGGILAKVNFLGPQKVLQEKKFLFPSFIRVRFYRNLKPDCAFPAHFSFNIYKQKCLRRFLIEILSHYCHRTLINFINVMRYRFQKLIVSYFNANLLRFNL